MADNLENKTQNIVPSSNPQENVSRFDYQALAGGLILTAAATVIGQYAFQQMIDYHETARLAAGITKTQDTFSLLGLNVGGLAGLLGGLFLTSVGTDLDDGRDADGSHPL